MKKSGKLFVLFLLMMFGRLPVPVQERTLMEMNIP